MRSLKQSKRLLKKSWSLINAKIKMGSYSPEADGSSILPFATEESLRWGFYILCSRFMSYMDLVFDKWENKDGAHIRLRRTGVRSSPSQQEKASNEAFTFYIHRDKQLSPFLFIAGANRSNRIWLPPQFLRSWLVLAVISYSNESRVCKYFW